MVEVVMLFIQLLRSVRDEAAETNTELRRSGEFLMAVTFTILGGVQAQRNGGGTGTDPHLLLLLDTSSIAIVLSLASSVLHLVLHYQLRLPLARLFLPLAAFFTAAAVVLLITSSISPSLHWVPFAVFFLTLLSLGSPSCSPPFSTMLQHFIVGGLLSFLSAQLQTTLTCSHQTTNYLRHQCIMSNHEVVNLESNPFSVAEIQKRAVGDTIQRKGINTVCGNRASRIDVGLSNGCSDGHPEVLKINGQTTSNPVYKQVADK